MGSQGHLRIDGRTLRDTALARLEAAGLLGRAQWERGCLIWGGSLRKGYGRFWIGDKHIPAHRAAYEIVIGPIPTGLTLDHLCRTRPCIWPFHMEPVTSRVNTLRGAGLPAVNAIKTHCKRGHLFDEENTRRFPMPSGRFGRGCRACQAAWHKENGHRYRTRSNAKRIEKAQLQRAADNPPRSAVVGTGLPAAP